MNRILKAVRSCMFHVPPKRRRTAALAACVLPPQNYGAPSKTCRNCDDYETKPIDFNRLFEKIDRLISKQA